MKHLTAASATFIAAVSALMLTGCNSDGSAVKQSVVTKTVTEAAPAKAPASAAAAEAPTTATDEDTSAADDSADDDSGGMSVVKFGDTYKFKGWSVSVSAPTPYTPSEYAAIDKKHPTYRILTVTVKNTSANKALDPSLINISAQIGDSEADSVYDDTVGDTPSASVLPGRSVSWKIAYGAKVGDQITVQVSDFTAFDGPTAAFDGKIS